MRRTVIGVVAAVLILVLLRGCFSEPASTDAEIFTVSRTAETAAIKEKLATREFVQGRWLFGLSMLLHGGYGRIQPGGYKVWPSMGSWELASTLTSAPSLVWVVIPEGLRKEQVADRLATALEWDDGLRDAFLEAPVAKPYELTDGFYFPDTYLIPVTETGAAVARRFINRFNENFDPLLPDLRNANIKYDTAVKLASVIQREAAGQHDMPLIAGILWNRLLIKMPLEVDATLQYARGNTGSGYWAPIDPSHKYLDSPFNTYMYPGLPPQPISNPGMDAIDAVLHSEETTCLFYLHSDDRQIHCADTYEGHLENIDVFLRGNPPKTQ
jgi:UPF0755 protein